MQFNVLQKLLIWLIPLIFAVTIHEVSHGFMAYLRGDKTAKMLGRLTLNPVKHMDILGTLILPALMLFATQGRLVFGWAKPVPIDARNFKKPRLDIALVAICGPLSNLIMAFMWAAIAKIGALYQINSPWLSLILQSMGVSGIGINIMLGVLNCIPLPPLDGSRILSSMLSARAAYQFNRFEAYGTIILMGLLISGILSYVILPTIMYIDSSIINLFGLT